MLSFILVLIALLIAATCWVVFDIKSTSLSNDQLTMYGLPATDDIEQLALNREAQFAHIAELKQRYARKRAAQQVANDVDMTVVLA